MNQQTRLIPLTKWSEFHPWPSTNALRHIVFNEKQNGAGKFIKRALKRVLIDEAAFFQWVEDQNPQDVPDKRVTAR